MKIVDFISSKANWQDLSALQPILDTHGSNYGLAQLEDAQKLVIREMCATDQATFTQNDISVAQSLAKDGYQLVRESLPQIDALDPTLCLLSRSKASHLPGSWSSLSAFACGNTVYSFIFADGDWKSVLKLNVIHELHHVVRYGFSRPHEIFRDWVMLEGLAGLFEKEKILSPHFLPGWESVSENELVSLLPRVMEFWDSPEFMKDTKTAGGWFFGSAELGVPRYFGYSLGLWLARQARQRLYPDAPWSELIQIPSYSFTLGMY